ncbi:MAG: hypothetical protein A3F26_03145 [Candidatus Ryanbacteria bacterium RIFCSPHIGHO2_12_FULL_47_12b]|uniref:Uncharacterized protein n=1 Tax=Candidatus Ryanbacteria bacterium RIFCSPLOWO2_02_FULL_47_14 TaxID=1802129 RepID=A0A1G2H1Z0_9BACT|nr:MAG: hypothetical protein UX74_C0031G0005 [Parcubacteria group bacterium GW2011_GWA2_47_10b]OGZ46407.1 MAG: hypothetical protein A2844_01520 [Candidatus Ryanbacteria bacterium RIFCSPHIGHO2_01_FULL_48_80]OGZ48537.1 MAG: hypothetical protein A3C83_02835 [Candidatus Ryanbacteria bacterium RIFCSPHIGHO2_02_FULL_47_25]OGZ52299.1 MAG: hypothetical protein A3F26_03145 [Candidatus Ryanbacteria bacterium RIFCSPHIGHO2_12_FULL_47_12b]OGZ52915.1 MAG: hypothetical protein A3A29_01095 [Candidatus Ryanbacte
MERRSKVANKDSRSGGKYSGNHTTLIPAAAAICDIAHECEAVTRISPGFIKAGLPPVNGRRRVKIVDKKGECILLLVRDNTSHQEVHVYVNDEQAAKLAIARGVREADLHLSFGKF